MRVSFQNTALSNISQADQVNKTSKESYVTKITHLVKQFFSYGASENASSEIKAKVSIFTLRFLA